MTYGFAPTQFGLCLIGLLEQKICHLSFWDQDYSQVKAVNVLFKEWNGIQFLRDDFLVEQVTQRIFSHTPNSYALMLKGTQFQIKVWQALLTIPYGRTTSYQSIAQVIGQPTAARAVGSAISKNNISFLIPCHRVISKSGKINNYRWGSERKKAMLEYEGFL